MPRAERLDALDKVWHKDCFRCDLCGLKLTLKTYKGYKKMPYCNLHYPSTRHTAVEDTPENNRLAKQAANQSEVAYDKEFEKEKSHYAEVNSGDRERLKNMATTSGLRYPHDRLFNPDALDHPFDFPPEDKHVWNPAVEPPPPHPPVAGSQGPVYVALYDYTSADDDEASFIEGDTITDVTIIDDGWLEGRVERTHEYGMMPSNYFEAQEQPKPSQKFKKMKKPVPLPEVGSVGSQATPLLFMLFATLLAMLGSFALWSRQRRLTPFSMAKFFSSLTGAEEEDDIENPGAIRDAE